MNGKIEGPPSGKWTLAKAGAFLCKQSQRVVLCMVVPLDESGTL